MTAGQLTFGCIVAIIIGIILIYSIPKPRYGQSPNPLIYLAAILFFGGLGIGLIASVVWNDEVAQRKIDECVAQGGQPVGGQRIRCALPQTPTR